MIRRIRRTLPWFGAIPALLLLALPVQADDIEPDPYFEEEVEPEPEPEVEQEAEPEIAATPDRKDEKPFDFEKIFDVERAFDIAIVRPLYFARLVVGIPFFVFYPFTIGSGYDEDVLALLWTDPVEATFNRPLGEVPSDY
jgi:hypothetical protein